MDMTKLDMNWGGPGFAAYEGRLEDDGAANEGPLDSQGRVEAAMAAFTGSDEGEGDQQEDKTAAGDGQGQGSGEGQGSDQKEGQQQVVEGQLTDEQRNADPVFKELSEYKDQVAQVFDKHGLTAAAEANGRTPHEEADLQLSDANILYKIMRGEGTPSSLLDTMVQVGNWQKPQIDAVAGDMMAWLQKQGYLKDGQAAAPGKKGPGKEGDPGFKDPLDERLTKLESANEKATREGQEATQRAERDRVGKVFTDHVEKLSTEAGIAKEDFPFYASQIAALVNGNKAITDRVAKGNFVDIKKFFDTVHGRELQRLERFNKAQLAKQQQKARNPKNSAGGTPPHPAGSAKPKVVSRDDRIAAATGLLQGN